MGLGIVVDDGDGASDGYDILNCFIDIPPKWITG